MIVRGLRKGTKSDNPSGKGVLPIRQILLLPRLGATNLRALPVWELARVPPLQPTCQPKTSAAPRPPPPPPPRPPPGPPSAPRRAASRPHG